MSLKDIIKTEKIIKILPHESLSSALSKLSTSHDAAFLFTPENKYVGIINPYYCLIKSSFPGNARVEHCVYHAPKIYVNYPLSRVAKLFIESKIHYLPVFDQADHFLGIISARHIIAMYLNSKMFDKTIEQALKTKKHPLAVIYEDDIVGEAVHMFKTTKFSKLVVINRDLKLKGILSYYDLISYLVMPKSSPERGEREGNKISFSHQKLKNFIKTYVLTLSKEHRLVDVAHLILEKKIGSVVVTDSTRHPIGIITTRDLLRFIIQEEPGGKIELISRNLSEHSRHILGGFFYRISDWLKKEPDVPKARLLVKEEKGGNLFTAVLSLFPKKGNPKVIKKEGRNLNQVLKPLGKFVKKTKEKEN